jgi:hypothetical protein
MCNWLARVGRWCVCIHCDDATVAVWVTNVAGCGGMNPFAVLDEDANTTTMCGRQRLLAVVRERAGQLCFG